MKDGKVWGIVGDFDGPVDKEKIVTDRYKGRAWKIQYNEFGLKSEAKSIQTELSAFTGLNKSTFPTSKGLPRPKDLKVWFGEQLLWDYTQQERLPQIRELVSQLGLIENNNWLIQKHI